MRTVRIVLAAVLGVVLVLAPAAVLAQTGVSGSGDRSRPPVLAEGTSTDLLGQPSALWYALAVRPGQRLTVELRLTGLPAGPQATSASFEAELEDADRQSLGAAAEPFTGRDDVTLAFDDVLISADVTLLRVGLRALGPAVELADIGYPLTIDVTVSGQPTAAASQTPAAPRPAASERGAEDVLPPTARIREPSPDGGGVDGGRLGAGLFAFATGCAVGYELTRRR